MDVVTFGHIAKRCKVKVVCSHCRNRHSTILCPKLEETKKVEENFVQSSVNIEQSLSNHNFPEVLLQTLVVELIADNKSRRTRLVLDSGSHKSYITSSLAEEMGYPMIREQQLIHSLFGGTVTDAVTHRCYKVRMRSLTEDYSCNFEVLDQPIICSNISSIRPGPWLAELKKMDIVVTDIKEGPIEILVGADIMGKLLTGQQKYLSCGLSAIHTLLGWTLMGKANSTDAAGSSSNMMVNSMLCNDISISNLWRLDVLGIQDPQENKTEEENEKLVMEHFLSTVKRRKDGRYEVDMPWIKDHPPLPTNFYLAKGRLDNVVKKLKSGNLYDKYNSIFEEWKAEEIIEELSVETIDITGYFLPHHPVIKPFSSTTKIRPVFDATAHERQQPSINQCLEKGVNLIEQIPSMLFRFRCKKFGVIADIRKAFLQIGLNPRDREFLKFLWYDVESRNLRIFRHARVVFGITCSPFLLGAVIEYHLQNLLLDESSLFSKTVIQQLRKAFYVDNIVTSVDTEENLDVFIEESSKILLDGKFELRGWEYSLLENNETFIDKLSPLLGLVWNRNLDVLQLSTEGLNSTSTEKVTKRTILSAAHKLFDPIGFTNPVALFPKLLLQETWALKLGWDTEVDERIKTDFKSWFKELKYLAQVQVPRWFFNSPDSQNSSLHIFCDASKHAYATAIFLRSESNVGIFITLVQAKSRVAPLKKLTIPRLELMAATIGARLSRKVREEIGFGIKTYFWTDSSTVLSWIKREDQWKPFVWNRVEEIRKYSDKNDWFHVNGENNPADLPSRGCFGKKLADERWWEGPAWLRRSPSEWTDQSYDFDDEIINAERKKMVTSCLNSNIKTFKWYYNYFSNYNKIIRLVAWVKRFISNCRRKHRESGDLTVIELNCAEKQIIKLMQEESFPLEENDPKLSTFCPFKDEEGILRICTKIADRDDSRDFRRPYILPAKHEVVNRLIASVHLKNCHAGVQCLITILRERFWILKCRQTVKSVVNKCHVCRRYSSKYLNSTPIPLPKDRVQDARIFQIVGVDLAGPLYIRSGEKVSITVYTCAVYRALHLEIVSSLSTIAFLQSLRRFIARRGRPTTMYSDNGSNFIGTVNALQKLDWQEISRESAIERIAWKFNPPTAAWWGGWWERLIRLVKEILRKMLGKSHLSMDELNTVLCECEALINSRPLTSVTEDNLDLATLTPKMFLQENSQTDAPDISRIVGEDLRRRFIYKQKLLEDLKKRFRVEYLGQLKLFAKKGPIKNINIGDIVFVSNPKQKRMDWILGRVIRILPSRDGEVRVVELKTMNGSIVRPVQHICPLEMEHFEKITKVDTGNHCVETSTNNAPSEEKNGHPKSDVEDQDDFPRTRCGRKVMLL